MKTFLNLIVLIFAPIAFGQEFNHSAIRGGIRSCLIMDMQSVQKSLQVDGVSVIDMFRYTKVEQKEINDILVVEMSLNGVSDKRVYWRTGIWSDSKIGWISENDPSISDNAKKILKEISAHIKEEKIWKPQPGQQAIDDGVFQLIGRRMRNETESRYRHSLDAKGEENDLRTIDNLVADFFEIMGIRKN